MQGITHRQCLKSPTSRISHLVRRYLIPFGNCILAFPLVPGFSTLFPVSLVVSLSWFFRQSEQLSETDIFVNEMYKTVSILQILARIVMINETFSRNYDWSSWFLNATLWRGFGKWKLNHSIVKSAIWSLNPKSDRRGILKKPTLQRKNSILRNGIGKIKSELVPTFSMLFSLTVSYDETDNQESMMFM